MRWWGWRWWWELDWPLPWLLGSNEFFKFGLIQIFSWALEIKRVMDDRKTIDAMNSVDSQFQQRHPQLEFCRPGNVVRKHPITAGAERWGPNCADKDNSFEKCELLRKIMDKNFEMISGAVTFWWRMTSSLYLLKIMEIKVIFGCSCTQLGWSYIFFLDLHHMILRVLFIFSLCLIWQIVT